MTDKILIDTNLWIYLYASNPQVKRRRIQELIQQNFEKVILSPQILGELYHVVTSKDLTDARIREADHPRDDNDISCVGDWDSRRVGGDQNPRNV